MAPKIQLVREQQQRDTLPGKTNLEGMNAKEAALYAANVATQNAAAIDKLTTVVAHLADTVIRLSETVERQGEEVFKRIGEGESLHGRLAKVEQAIGEPGKPGDLAVAMAQPEKAKDLGTGLYGAVARLAVSQADQARRGGTGGAILGGSIATGVIEMIRFLAS